MKGAAWLESEVEALRELWDAGATADAIAKRLPGRSVGAVSGKAHALALDAVWSLLPNRSRVAIQLKASELQVPRSKSRNRRAYANTLSDVDAAWLAGMVDGEGTVSLYRADTRARLYCARIGIANTYRPVMEHIANLTGVGFLTKFQKINPNARVGYQWLTNDTLLVRSLLLQIRPYLRIKHEQADLVLEYTGEWLNLERGMKPPCSERIIERLRHLNARGLFRTPRAA